MQSHEGVIRLFPVWPKGQNARFGRLRAVGAFLVTSELKGGVVQYVEIHSEKGCLCTVANPWPDRAVQLVRNGKDSEILTGLRITFDTEVGERIRLVVKQAR